MKKNNMIFITAIICVLICILLGVLIGNSLKKEKGLELVNNTSENAGEDSNISDKEKEIIDYLTLDNSLISPSDVVASYFPGGYYFSKNGTFVYYRGQSAVKESNEIISFKGSFTVSNNKIILKITEEEKAVGGILVDDVIQGQILTNYTREVESVNKTIEYTVDGFGQASYYNAPKYIKFNDGEKLYQLGGLGDYLNILIELDVKGYDAYSAILNSSNVRPAGIVYNQFFLEKQHETYQYDNKLYINFNAQEKNADEDIYKYDAEIQINDNIITVSGGYEIWPSSYTGRMKITKVGDYYFIISKVAKQVDGDFVIIIDNEGNIINYHNDVNFVEESLSLINGKVEYEIRDCKSAAINETCDSNKYTLS